MPDRSLLSRLRGALPVIIANAPVVIEAARRVRLALRRRRSGEPPLDGGA
jgi:hypothetical protein